MQGIVLRFVVVIALCILGSGRAWASSEKVALARVDHALAEMYEGWAAYPAQGGGAAFTSSTQLLPVSTGWVQIDAVAAGDVHELQIKLDVCFINSSPVELPYACTVEGDRRHVQNVGAGG